MPRLDATYGYDRINQLLTTSVVEGSYTFAYDELQRLTQVATTIPGTTLLTGTYSYGKRGAGPGMATTAGGTSLDYDELGYLQRYRGYDLDFNPEGQLVRASRPGGTTIAYHYDAWGERKITIVQSASGSPRVYRHVSKEYELRDGDAVWILEAGDGHVEVNTARGIRITAYLLDQLNTYVASGGQGLKPLPAEYMDLDGDGDGFDSGDLSVPSRGTGTRSPSAGRARSGAITTAIRSPARRSSPTRPVTSSRTCATVRTGRPMRRKGSRRCWSSPAARAKQSRISGSCAWATATTRPTWAAGSAPISRSASRRSAWSRRRSSRASTATA